MNCIQLLNKTEDFVEAHLHGKLTLEDLANHLHISKFHFHRRFRQCSSETLRQFISRIKMERSAIRLLASSDTITHIAHTFGFGDSSAYTRAFKRHYGMSPRAFKRARIDMFCSSAESTLHQRGAQRENHA